MSFAAGTGWAQVNPLLLSSGGKQRNKLPFRMEMSWANVFRRRHFKSDSHMNVSET